MENKFTSTMRSGRPCSPPPVTQREDLHGLLRSFNPFPRESDERKNRVTINTVNYPESWYCTFSDVRERGGLPIGFLITTMQKSVFLGHVKFRVSGRGKYPKLQSFGISSLFPRRAPLPDLFLPRRFPAMARSDWPRIPTTPSGTTDAMWLQRIPTQLATPKPERLITATRSGEKCGKGGVVAGKF